MVAMFDFLRGEGTTGGLGADAILQDDVFDADYAEAPPAPQSRVASFFQNPENIRMMGELAQALGGEGSVGGALGGAAASSVERTQAGKAAEKVSGQQQNTLQMLQQALGADPGSLVGPPEDDTTANKITMDANGTTLQLPRLGQSIPEEEGFSFSDTSLEQMTPRRTAANF